MTKIDSRKLMASVKLSVLLIIIMGFGWTFIASGWIVFINPPPPDSGGYTRYFLIPSDRDERDGIRIDATSGNGLLPNNQINANLVVTIREDNKNTTTIDARLPNAAISNGTYYLAEENKIVHLHYNRNQNYNFTSTYSSQPTISYLYGGEFDVILNITNSDANFMQKKFGTTEKSLLLTLPSVIVIQSADSRQSEIQSQHIAGLTVMILGVTIVASATTITQVIDNVGAAIPTLRSKPKKIPDKMSDNLNKVHYGAPEDLHRD